MDNNKVSVNDRLGIVGEIVSKGFVTKELHPRLPNETDGEYKNRLREIYERGYNEMNKKEITAFETGAQRESNDIMKGRMDMIPGCAIIRVSKRFQEACIPYGKYPEFNWQKGMPISRYLDSAIRHLYSYLDGQLEEDHLAAACTNILMAMWTEEKLPQMQDIPAIKKENN